MSEQSANDENGLSKLQEAIPVLLQFSGLVGFVIAQGLWLGFSRPEPEFMGICLTVAAGGYIGQGLLGLRSQPSPPELRHNGDSPGPPEP